MSTGIDANNGFVRALRRSQPLLLDGGLATQLESQGCDLGNPLWSASMLLENPDAIVEASLAFLEAGARCIATASYQASREGFATLGYSAEEADGLMRLSVELAKRARDAFDGARPLVAASIGPYGAMLHDGSEYTGNYGVPSETLWQFHEERLRLFDGSGADVLAVETIPSLSEARVLAAGINCTPPQYTTALIRILRDALPGKAVVAYPNSGEKFNASDNAWSGDAVALTVAEWVSAGARIVGGCCRVGPGQIRAMAAALEEK